MTRFLALLVLFSAGAAAGQAQTLSNDIVSAKFGLRGLDSLTDAAAGASYEFTRDEFAVTIDGKRYDSRSLGAPQRLVVPNRVGYRWNVPPFRIEAVYELLPGDRFISKQVAVTSAARDRFRVDAVVVFDDTLAQPVAGAYIQPAEYRTLELGSYAVALRLDSRRGLLALAQNPFLRITREGSTFTVGYEPAMEWTATDGGFISDRGILAPYQLTGRRLPAQMVPEWQLETPTAGDGMDEAEVSAFTAVVRSFLLHRPGRPLNLFVGWCVNDYQIDIAAAAGRAEYKRVIDRAAELGAEHVLFAPTNSELARRDDSTDDWSWENLLWLGLGQKIRRNEWNPKTGAVPASVQEMLDYARSRRVSLVAYVYPVLAFSQNPEWLVTRRDAKGRVKTYASLGHRALQDWLVETLVEFRKKTGISGYSFDHTFLNFDGPGKYAQWWGWRRVLETLRQRMPDLVIDGRQAYHRYGPWTWLAGSYPHPTYHDEQPESFTPFPDLSFDRVSAARERYTAYKYRNYDYAPSEIVPGFITHQTSRSDETGEMPQRKTDRGTVLEPFRVRDWDYLGWRYSLVSSVAVGGWNNVLNMIPARDPDEFRHFSEADKQFFRDWLAFARQNRELLRWTRTILGQPAIGKVDGTAAIFNNHGFIFLFNPNGRRLRADLRLDATTGLTGTGRYYVEEIFPQRGRARGAPDAGFWSHGATVPIEMDGHSAVVLQVQPAPWFVERPMLFNVSGSLSVLGTSVSITNARGEAGTSEELMILLPKTLRIEKLQVDGRNVPFTSTSEGLLTARVTFEGARFQRAQAIGGYDPSFAGGTLKARFSVPRRIFDQLARRQEAWPIPWTAEDLRTTWLAPHRLLLHVQIAEPDDRWEPRLSIDGQQVPLERAYSAVRPVRATFVGFYADLSRIEAERDHELLLDLPPLRPGQFQGIFFENVEPEYTPVSPSR